MALLVCGTSTGSEVIAEINALITKLAGIEAGATADLTGAEIKALYEAVADTNALTDALLAKLNGIESNATADQTDAEIKTAYENNANTNEFSDAEKTKLAGLESSHFKGQYVSLAALQTAHPTASIGDYANVDGGIGSDVTRYAWDSDDSAWVEQLGSSAILTDAEIKTQYENNADTNAYTDTEKAKLAAIEEGATGDQTGAEIKALYEALADTNALTDALLSKLNGIAAGAQVNVIESLLDDTSPQLGGDLDLNGNAIPLSLNAQTGTAYTAVLGDAEKIITLNNAGAITMTIPANASVAYPIGTKLNFMQLGAGAVTIAITTDTLSFDSALTAVLNGQYAVATAVKVTATSWVLFGNLAAA